MTEPARAAHAPDAPRTWRDRLFAGSRRPFPRLPANPEAPHPFQPIQDDGFVAATSRSAGGPGGQPPGMNVALAGTFMRDQRCGLPRCGRDRDDALHFPEAR